MWNPKKKQSEFLMQQLLPNIYNDTIDHKIDVSKKSKQL